jgi:hypothetical protein
MRGVFMGRLIWIEDVTGWIKTTLKLGILGLVVGVLGFYGYRYYQSVHGEEVVLEGEWWKSSKPEDVLQKLEDRSKGLDGAERQAWREFAKGEAELLRETEDAERLRKLLPSRKDNMKKLATDLEQAKKSPGNTLKYNGRVYTVAEVEKDLEVQLETYNDLQDAVNAKDKTVVAIKERVAALKQKAESFAEVKAKIKHDLENLRSQIATVRTQESKSGVNAVGAPQLEVQIQEQIRALDIQMKASSKMLGLNGAHIQAIEEKKSDIVQLVKEATKE